MAENAEIEALCSIWEDVEVIEDSQKKIIKHKIRSMENEATSASIRIRIEIFEGYPEVEPKIELSMARGISERDFEELKLKVVECVKESLGMPIVDVFQTCCDFLTDRQHFSDLDCSICISPLSNSPIIVTSCDHFLHFSCFSKYLHFSKTEIVKNLQEAQKYDKDKVDQHFYCPICRYNLSNSTEFEREFQKILEFYKKNQKTLKAPRRDSVVNGEDAERNLKIWREQQKRLAKIFEKQKLAGGIIDIEEEKKRLRLISENFNE
ncbi:unnamed protein product [Caenorhabditis angaria]|uniref:RWD domain-containing protein n=1 Tax=Caenorhabditis angaria TaxID=860376 RepID=A0A9P1IE46_9PELO|nr:unnamed protein product [Caenorhabditis angaria]